MIANKLQTISIQQLLTITLGLVVSIGIVAGLMGAVSSAQEAEDDGGNAANALKISPVRTDVSADPGETKVVKVTVTNPSSSRVGIRVIQNDFIAGDEDGTPAIILDETEFAENNSLKRFMTPIENVTLEGNESRVIEAQIVVPADAEPGGYFGVVRFAPTNPDDGGQVNVSPSVASLILLTVNGDAPEKLSLTEFLVKQDGRTKSFFTTGEDLNLAVRFENTGKVQAGPFGKVSVTKGDELVYDVDFNDKEQRDMVLPGSARRFTIPLEQIGGIGKYTVSATFTYGTQNKTIEVTESFWLIPRTAIIAGAVGLVLLIAAIAGSVFYVRRRRNSFSGSFGPRAKR